jgi:hypothetical protein
MMKIFIQASAALISLGMATVAAGQAQAAVIVVNQTLDLTQPQAGGFFQGWQGTPAFNGGFNVDIAQGDTFDFTIDFLGSQTLTLANLSFIWAFSYSGEPASDVTGTGTFSFLDSLGSAFLTSNVKTDTEGSVHFGQFFNDSDFTGGLPTSITFSGVRYNGTLDSYSNQSITTRSYDNPALLFLASPAVPEPASWVLMIAGFGLAGAAMRRRRSVRVTYA